MSKKDLKEHWADAYFRSNRGNKKPALCGTAHRIKGTRSKNVEYANDIKDVTCESCKRVIKSHKYQQHLLGLPRMEFEEFKKHFKRVALNYGSDIKDLEFFWSIKMLFHDLTQYIDYNCRFNSEGICIRRQRYTNPQPYNCCGGCASTAGHNRHVPPEETLRELYPYFNKRSGFWRAGVGCTLPRRLRSRVCVLHHCVDLSWQEQQFSNFVRDLVYYCEKLSKAEIIAEYERFAKMLASLHASRHSR